MLLTLSLNLGFAWGTQSGPVGTPATGYNRYDEGAAMRVVTLTDVTGLREWIDYVPVYVVTDSNRQWRVDEDGFIPIVEE